MWKILFFTFTMCFLEGFVISDDTLDVNVTPDLIRLNGYPVEEHSVETKDGYIITMHRIPQPNKPGNKIKLPVLIQHGLVGSSACWVSNSPADRNLGFTLADSGYDVWLGNFRGTTYGRKHKTLNTTDAEFWNYNIQDIAEKDLPAMINRILQETSAARINYIGHSMGTTVMFALLSLQPKYNTIVRTFFAMAPVTTPIHSKPFQQLKLEAFEYALVSVSEEFTLDNPIIKFSKALLCMGLSSLCENFLLTIGAFNEQEIEKDMRLMQISHLPDVTSTHVLGHFAQENPPEYELAAITAPVVLLWSSADELAHPEDVAWIRTNLVNVENKQDYRVPSETFSHFGFMWDDHAKELLYDKILKLMN